MKKPRFTWEQWQKLPPAHKIFIPLDERPDPPTRSVPLDQIAGKNKKKGKQ